MCGIVGLLDPSCSPEEIAGLVDFMTRQLAHRGPDGQQVWFDADAHIALGHRRLAILDLSSTGDQPMVSHDGRLVITYNGEIYNHRELRAELEQAGHRFRGTSDTEVLIEACAQWGVERTLGRCAGMFAFALWDRSTRCLTLARDRLGVKPLYWTKFGATVLFGSELKSLLAHPRVERRIDSDALSDYVRYNFIPAPGSIYSGISKLPPGTILTIRPGVEPIVSRYWDVADCARLSLGVPFVGSLHEATEEIDARLRTIVRQHAIADVPVGVFLSGGVDSSTIAAILQSTSSARVHSFSIGFSDAAYDESADARRVAAHLGTDHEDMIFAPADALAMLSKLPACYDEPFADASQLPTLLVSKLARSKVKVVLSGDGGDEVFAGYNRHAMAASHEFLRIIPHDAGKIVRALRPGDWDRLGRLVPRTLRPRQIGDKLHKLSRCFGSPDMPALYDALLTGWEPGSLVPARRHSTESIDLAGIADPVLRMQLLDIAGYLPDDILTKVDRASMSVGLEARVPFLDHRLLELAFRLPRRFVRRRARGKIVLRQVLQRYVPAPLFERPKAGFAVPLERWLMGPLRDWAETRLSMESLSRDGLVEPAPVRRAWAEQLSGRGNHAVALWGVLMLAEWCEHVHRRDHSWRPKAA